jgi:FAD synthase
MQYTISGKVVKGDGYGRKLGFPTVNLEPNKNTEEFPPEGVYAGTVVLEDKEYRAGIAINSKNKIDAHLLGYSGDAYEKEAVFKINKFLREYKKFNTEEELIAQIKKDLEQC